MSAYYNEIDPYAADWLRNLIAAGHIAPGDVDTRSIEDVQPDDLRGYTQCHFFAGIGVWSYALRRAGWVDDRSVWTGSCPCQPFSAAGKGLAFADERHLWPAFYHLIGERKPPVVLGEQVASAAVDDWIDLVHADLEALGYAFGSVPFPSAGVGAPHIRDRNYWVARANDTRLEGRRQPAKRTPERLVGPRSVAGRLAYAYGGHASAEREQRSREQRQQPQDSGVVRLADPHCADATQERTGHDAQHEQRTSERGRAELPSGPGAGSRVRARGHSAGCPEVGTAGTLAHVGGPGPTNGFWRDADWLGCRDGKWRPVEPGTFPLAHGAAARVGRLRAYGNAINAEAARVFIECVMECQP